mmetsp:Transcript_30093/g.62917  ORF Transcript_30093/g.62917 Transcript_30093/m.62917 type:complete len:228 (-) Transcript_30093:44-727(-)
MRGPLAQALLLLQLFLDPRRFAVGLLLPLVVFPAEGPLQCPPEGLPRWSDEPLAVGGDREPHHEGAVVPAAVAAAAGSHQCALLRFFLLGVPAAGQPETSPLEIVVAVFLEGSFVATVTGFVVSADQRRDVLPLDLVVRSDVDFLPRELDGNVPKGLGRIGRRVKDQDVLEHHRQLAVVLAYRHGSIGFDCCALLCCAVLCCAVLRRKRTLETPGGGWIVLVLLFER